MGWNIAIMNQSLQELLDRESLSQLSKEELVDMLMEQANITQQLQKVILELQQEIERLKVSRDLDSKASSKPPPLRHSKKTRNE